MIEIALHRTSSWPAACFGVRQEGAGSISRGWQDKARFLAAGTSFLSFCLHIVFAPLGFDAVRCSGGASDAIFFVFNGPSAIARNVWGRSGRATYADASVSTLLYDDRISLLPVAF
jgi:hypothetical protein